MKYRRNNFSIYKEAKVFTNPCMVQGTCCLIVTVTFFFLFSQGSAGLKGGEGLPGVTGLTVS